jgi:hypothetical protein
MNLDQALAALQLYTDNRDYRLVKLHPRAITAAAGVVAELGEPFAALIVDKDEVTLLMPDEAWTDFAARLPGHIAADTLYRLITCDVALDLSLVGFMARVSRALADAGVSILPYSAYTRDHIFVPADKLNVAMAAIEKLKSGS